MQTMPAHDTARRIFARGAGWSLVLGALLALAGRAEEPASSEASAIALHAITAQEFAVQARSLLTERQLPGEVFADSATNQVFVRGPAAVRQLVKQLAQSLDRPAAPATVGEETGVDIVRGYPFAPERLEAAAAQLKKKFPASTGVRIAVDARTQQLVIVGNAQLQVQIGEAVRQLATAAAPLESAARVAKDDAAETRSETGTYQLRNVTWREFEDSLRRLWRENLALAGARSGETTTVQLPGLYGDRELMRIDHRTNQIQLTNDDPVTHVWERLARALDAAPPVGGQVTELITLRQAEPSRVQRALDVLQSSQKGAPGAGRAKDRTTAIAPIRSAAGPRPRNMLAMIFQPAAQPPEEETKKSDTPAAPTPAPTPTPDIETGEEGGFIGDVQIEFVPELGVIVIRGNKRDVARVTRIIEEIEKQSQQTQPEIEVALLEHANSVALGEILTKIYDEVFKARQGPVSITALGKPNGLLLIGRRESLDVVFELIQKLDKDVPAETQFEVFPLKHIAALSAQEALTTFFTERTGLGARLVAVAEQRSNSLIVQASPRDMEEVRSLLERIDVATAAAALEVRIFKLKNAMAQDLATVIQDAVSGQATRTAAGGQAIPGAQPGGAQQQQQQSGSVLQLMLVDPEAGQMLRSGILAEVRVRADANSNSLIVAAPADSMELLAALIERLDSLPSAEAQIKVFTVENGDATTLAAMLQQLFGQQVTIGQGTGGGLFGGGGFNAANQFGTQTGAGAGEGSLVPLRFAVDARTNSIIVSGSAGDLAVVEIILLRLDEGDVETRRTTVFRLKNAPAQDVANSITQFLTSQRQLLQQNLLFNRAISPFEQIEREVIVVPELVSNSLIVSATPRYYEQILKVIEDLDFRPPMVLVQVLIAEVKLDNQFEFGVEMGLQDSLLFNRGIAALAPNNPVGNPGFNFNNGGPGLPNLNSASRENVGGQALSNFGVGRNSEGRNFGGLVLSAGNESVALLIRALQESGKLQILSRPQIATLNNQQAFVQVGDNIPRITSSQISQIGNIVNTWQDVETGLILRVQPRINEDGIVVMNVDAERSFLDNAAQGVDVGNGTFVQPIRRTTAQTTISAKSGQTVVFAGLIVTEKGSTERRVPVLADIPVLGRLFQFQSNETSRSELMIVLTPHIVQTDEDYEYVKATESQRMSWCLGDVISVHGDVGLGGGSNLFCPDLCPVIYPDQAPGMMQPGPSEYDAMPHGAPGPTPAPLMEPPVPGSPPPVVVPTAPVPEPAASLQRGPGPNNRRARATGIAQTSTRPANQVGSPASPRGSSQVVPSSYVPSSNENVEAIPSTIPARLPDSP